jgi:hypothetical protein
MDSIEDLGTSIAALEAVVARKTLIRRGDQRRSSSDGTTSERDVVVGRRHAAVRIVGRAGIP